MNRVAFYPCCSTDFTEPYSILSEMVDEIIFCDISHLAEKEFHKQQASFPKASFLLQDVLIALAEIDQIDVFFYRKDSNGEGGSAIYFFGDHVFPLIVEKINKNGALIISDGSNARGANWRKIKRKNGAERYHRKFKPAADQKYLSLNGNGPLMTIQVYPIE